MIERRGDFITFRAIPCTENSFGRKTYSDDAYIVRVDEIAVVHPIQVYYPFYSGHSFVRITLRNGQTLDVLGTMFDVEDALFKEDQGEDETDAVLEEE